MACTCARWATRRSTGSRDPSCRCPTAAWSWAAVSACAPETWNHSRRVLLRWDGHQLAGAGQPLAIAPTEDAYVDALAAIGSRVFIGGDFRQLSDGTSVANLARFDGQTCASACPRRLVPTMRWPVPRAMPA